MNIPVLGFILAGKYDKSIVEQLKKEILGAIKDSTKQLVDAEVGVGYGKAAGMSRIREKYDGERPPLSESVSVIKITDLMKKPIAVIFNYATHPTKDGSSMLFSADFVHYARERIKEKVALDLHVQYINGAQGDVSASKGNVKTFGNELGDIVSEITNVTDTKDFIEIDLKKHQYRLAIRLFEMPFLGAHLNIKTSVSVLSFNKKHVFITIPGELCSLYQAQFDQFAILNGYEHASVFGLTNGAHGYIMPPEIWMGSYAIYLSFGGRYYGRRLERKIRELMLMMAP